MARSAVTCHYQLSQAQFLADGERLVFYVQLRDYRPSKLTTGVHQDIDTPAMAWLESEWRRETRAAPPLFDFIRKGSLMLLLDGLNEIPRCSDDEYQARVEEWRVLIDAIADHYPNVRLLFACRPLDYSQRLDAGRHTLPEIEIQAMEPERIKAFIDKRFDEAVAAPIWSQLEEHPLAALEWRQGRIGQDAIQQRVRENRQIILDALDKNASAEQIRDYYKFSLANAKWWQERISASEEVFDDWLLDTYPPPDGPFVKPEYWRSLTWSNPAQPVVGVCWYEAQAYCLWLNAMLGSDHYRLPTEAEWEAAGRGRGVWRRYAWPGDFDPLRANTAETRLDVTTPVGVFPDGATPDTGLLDLCGNVWEWTATPWSEGEALLSFNVDANKLIDTNQSLNCQ